jgi:putative DNA primase/helicase
LRAQLARANKALTWALKSEAAPRINAMLDLARSEPGVPVLPDSLDRDPWLFNCPNGTLDLRTGELRQHQRDDLITKLCPTEYHPDAACPHWLSFLDAIAETGKTDT